MGPKSEKSEFSGKPFVGTLRGENGPWDSLLGKPSVGCRVDRTLPIMQSRTRAVAPRNNLFPGGAGRVQLHKLSSGLQTFSSTAVNSKRSPF